MSPRCRRCCPTAPTRCWPGTGRPGTYSKQCGSCGTPPTWHPERSPTGRTDVAEWYERLRTYTLATFPAGPGEEWIQIRQRDGSPLEATVALPVKDPFHIARSLLLLAELG